MCRPFTKLIAEICGKHNWKLETFCDEWVLQITDQNIQKTIRVIGYSFPINNQVASLSANDKGLTCQFLSNAKLPVVEHEFIYGDYLRRELKLKTSLGEDIKESLKKFNFPVVVKPNKGTQGREVFLCTSDEELLIKSKIISATDDLCIAKYEESEFEYRFYFLDDEVLLFYKKRRVGDWKHNLSNGAMPEVLDIKNYSQMSRLATLARQALGLRICAVDIFDTREGMKVLEVNNGISLTHFAASSEEYHNLALEVYERYLLESFKVV